MTIVRAQIWVVLVVDDGAYEHLEHAYREKHQRLNEQAHGYGVISYQDFIQELKQSDYQKKIAPRITQYHLKIQRPESEV